MQKSLLSALALLLIVTLAGMDYLLNFRGEFSGSGPAVHSSPQGGVPLPVEVVENQAQIQTDLIQKLLQGGGFWGIYTPAQRQRTFQLFDRFDLGPVTGIEVYRNQLNGSSDTLIIDEIHAASGQGRLAYLNIKLALNSQIASPDMLNEVNGYGQNALFYNPPDQSDVAFLLTRQGDTLLGFQYSKTSSTAFSAVQGMIKALAEPS